MDFFKTRNRIRYLVLFDYSYCDKICDKIKYLVSKKLVLQIALIIVLQESKLIYIVLYPLKKF